MESFSDNEHKKIASETRPNQWHFQHHFKEPLYLLLLLPSPAFPPSKSLNWCIDPAIVNATTASTCLQLCQRLDVLHLPLSSFCLKINSVAFRGSKIRVRRNEHNVQLNTSLTHEVDCDTLVSLRWLLSDECYFRLSTSSSFSVFYK